MDHIEIRKNIFESVIDESITDLYRLVFGEQSLKAWEVRYKWQFIQNPATQMTPSVYWSAWMDGRIVGFLGSFPALVKIGERIEALLIPCDLMVAREARGKKIGYQLIEAFINSCGSAALALVYTDAAKNLYSRMGFHEVDLEPYFFRVCNWASLLSGYPHGLDKRSKEKSSYVLIRNLMGTALDIPMFLISGILRPSSGVRIGVQAMMNAEQAGKSFDIMWNEFSSDFSIIGVRNGEYATWRYFSDPLSVHHILIARSPDGKPKGYLAYRWTKKRGLEVVQVMDIFCKPHDVETIDALLNTLMGIIGRQAAMILCKGLDSRIRKRLGRYLFFKLPQRKLAMIKCNDNLPFFYEPSNWHIAYADGDEDFQP